MFFNESKILALLPFKNISYLIALDEVGRGAGAGPVVVCASLWKVSNKSEWVRPKWLALVADSKELSFEKRAECFSFICRDYNISTDFFFHNFTENNTNFHFTISKLITPQKVFKFSQKELKKTKSQENKVFDCVCFSLGIASNHEIDKINIWNAIQIATNRALFKIQETAKESVKIFLEPILFLVDGHIPIKMCHEFTHIPQVAIINGDALLKTIGFSSILAKVSRDKFMTSLKEKFPHIGFEAHKGYLTPKHQANLQKFGQTPFHRQSFLKNFVYPH